MHTNNLTLAEKSRFLFFHQHTDILVENSIICVKTPKSLQLKGLESSTLAGSKHGVSCASKAKKFITLWVNNLLNSQI